MTQVQTIEQFETLEQEGELTVIHFVYRPKKIYVAGWWVNVIPTIFIRPVGTQDRLGLVLAFNIPIAPVKHYFRSVNESLHFTLFFPALSKNTTHIDIIEKESGNKGDVFNFYNVPMERIKNGVLKS